MTAPEALAQLFAAPPQVSSGGLGWEGVYLDCRRVEAGAMDETALPWHAVTMLTQVPHPPQVQRRLDGRRRNATVNVGEIIVVPAQTGHGVSWDTPGEFVLLAIEPLTLVQQGTLERAPRLGDLRPQFSTPDPLMQQLLLALLHTAATGGSRLYAESLVRALGMHLQVHYGDFAPRPQAAVAAQQLQPALDYVHAHLHQPLGIGELARIVHLSPSHFTQQFKRVTGCSPHQYVVQQRVERAKVLLRRTSLSIATIAQRVGFAHQSHLHRHFKRRVGTTPGSYRRG